MVCSQGGQDGKGRVSRFQGLVASCWCNWSEEDFSLGVAVSNSIRREELKRDRSGGTEGN